MPTAPSASWVTECAACHHTNPARAHFCSVCGAPLQSPAAAAAKAMGAGRSAPATADGAEPQGFMLHFNDDDSLAIAPRYTSPDPGEAYADTAAAAPHGAGPAAEAHGAGAAAAAHQRPPHAAHAAHAAHAEFRFSLPGPHPQESVPAAATPPGGRTVWTTTTVAAAMLTLTALVGTGSYLLGRSSGTAEPAYGAAHHETLQPATATAAAALHTTTTAPGAQPLGAAPAQPGQAVADSLAQAQRALAMSESAAAGRAAVMPVAPALPARQVAQGAAGAKAAPSAVVPPAPATRAPAPATPCNATVAALGLCEQ